MNTPYISVIIPVYNDSERLRLCLNALKEQSIGKENFEVIIVDNNSTEDIQEVISDFDQVYFKYLLEKKIGSYAARNGGIEAAVGEILAFTDSDCIPDKDWLLNGTKYLAQNHNVGIVAGSVKLFYKSKNLNAVEVYEKYTAFRQEENARSGSCVGANWFSYKEVIDRFGRFDASLKSNGDTVLSTNISKAGLKVVYADNAVVLHPSRYTYKEIGNKFRRLFGGNYDRAKGNKFLFSLSFLGRFIFRRIRFNLKKVVEITPTESFKLFKVNFYLFYILISEAGSLALGKKSKRL